MAWKAGRVQGLAILGAKPTPQEKEKGFLQPHPISLAHCPSLGSRMASHRAASSGPRSSQTFGCLTSSCSMFSRHALILHLCGPLKKAPQLSPSPGCMWGGLIQKALTFFIQYLEQKASHDHFNKSAFACSEISPKANRS